MYNQIHKTSTFLSGTSLGLRKVFVKESLNPLSFPRDVTCKDCLVSLWECHLMIKSQNPFNLRSPVH